MKLTDRSFWDALVTAANSDAKFNEYCSHLKDMTVGMQVDQQQYVLRFDSGRVHSVNNDLIPNCNFFISGPLDEWLKLARGELFYAQAIHSIHGGLKGEGDILKHIWATESLWELWRVSAQLFQEGEAQ